MKRDGWISGIAVIVVGGVIAGAQSSSSTANPQTDQKSITVTGCLQPASAPAGTAGTSGGTTAGSTASDRFVLTNARLGAGLSSSASGSTTGSTTGTTSATTGGTTAGAATGRAMDATGASYILEGKASDLRNHVNHQVEVTGRLDSSNSTGSGTTTRRFDNGGYVHLGGQSDASRRPAAAGGIGTDGGGDLLRTLMPDWCGLRGRTSFFDGGKDNKCVHGRRVGAALNGRAATAHALRLLALATPATRARLLRCSTDGS
jgi:hypothetical protein